MPIAIYILPGSIGVELSGGVDYLYLALHPSADTLFRADHGATAAHDGGVDGFEYDHGADDGRDDHESGDDTLLQGSLPPVASGFL
jgi:hypothetical protein